jgi:hypothetical protein
MNFGTIVILAIWAFALWMMWDIRTATRRTAGIV